MISRQKLRKKNLSDYRFSNLCTQVYGRYSFEIIAFFFLDISIISAREYEIGAYAKNAKLECGTFCISTPAKNTSVVTYVCECERTLPNSRY